MTASLVSSSSLGHAPPIALDRRSAPEATQGLPLLVRKALGLAAAIEVGRLDLILPDGRQLRAGRGEDGPEATLVIRDFRFASRLARRGDAGFSEGFVLGEWDTPDLPGLLALLAANRAALRGRLPRPPLARLRHAVRSLVRRNTRARARRNARAHYDLGNPFYAAWLDPGMTYSAALFEGRERNLGEAQDAKYRAIAEATGLRAGDRVLEIGCGWGGFAEFAAGVLGCRVTGLTLSREQLAHARRRLAHPRLGGRAEVALTDYRDAAGEYDRIVSIEMFEAVGEADWPTYFRVMHDRLRPGGRAGLQVITIGDEHFDAYRLGDDVIRRTIFPGGMLPSRGALLDLGRRAGFRLAAERAFGLDYARTLAIWRERFRAAGPQLEAQGYDERFRRRWEYYLAYCEAGFLSGNLECRQVVFEKPA